MSHKSPGYRQVEWTSKWEHPLEFWLVRSSPVIDAPQASVQREREQQADAAKRDERAREAFRQGTALFGDRPKSRLCPDGCGAVLMRGVTRHPEMDADSPSWDFIYKCAQGDSADDFTQASAGLPLRPAVSVAQVRWARDMIAQASRKSPEQIAQENNISWEQLLHYARSSTEGLPEKAGQRKPAEKPVKPKSTKKAKGA
jgi:hypothetical protein